MKKIISIFLILGLLICICGCDSSRHNNIYKKIEYQNDEIFDIKLREIENILQI